MPKLSALADAVARGSRADAARLTGELIREGTPPRAVLERGLVPGMEIVGARFTRSEIFVPEMLIAARAMKEAMKVLEPLLEQAGVAPLHTAVIGTVQGDLHDIGKNLVATMWRGANLRVVDLGANVAPDRFVGAVREHGARIVGLSALLTTTMPAMRTVVQALATAGLDEVKVIVGGAAVTHEFASSIGAHGYAADAGAAVDVARGLAGCQPGR